MTAEPKPAQAGDAEMTPPVAKKEPGMLLPTEPTEEMVEAMAKVPKGWTLVPTELTPDMIAALSGQPYNNDHFLDNFDLMLVWKAALSAAASVPVGED